MMDSHLEAEEDNNHNTDMQRPSGELLVPLVLSYVPNQE
jgi:hypothetical protein